MAVTLENLHDEVLIIVRDTSESVDDMINPKLNEALMAVADSITVPELKRIGSFTTVIDQSWATMPDGFNGKLHFVGNESTSLAIADGGVAQLMSESPLLDESGTVHTVALEGNIMYYQGIPSEATTFPILYTVWPAELVLDSDEVPSWIPPHLQRGVLIHYAASLIFDIIEDGIEGEKVNTAAQLGLHQKYLSEFMDYVGKRRIASRRSVWLN